jgi:hypothetical protein
MRDRLPLAFGIGLAVVVVAVAGILFVQRGSRIRLEGSVLKVRTAPLDEKSSVAVIDFRFANPADYRFVVRTVSVILEDKSGNEFTGAVISEADAKRLFEALPLLGEKYNESLLMRDTVPPQASQDRMIAARFEAPESTLEARRRFLVRIEDVDGPVAEISER